MGCRPGAPGRPTPTWWPPSVCPRASNGACERSRVGVSRWWWTSKPSLGCSRRRWGPGARRRSHAAAKARLPVRQFEVNLSERCQPARGVIFSRPCVYEVGRATTRPAMCSRPRPGHPPPRPPGWRHAPHGPAWGTAARTSAARASIVVRGRGPISSRCGRVWGADRAGWTGRRWRAWACPRRRWKCSSPGREAAPVPVSILRRLEILALPESVEEIDREQLPRED